MNDKLTPPFSRRSMTPKRAHTHIIYSSYKIDLASLIGQDYAQLPSYWQFVGVIFE
ncbi:hypothetical protein [Bartonella sp. CB178]|uniref:hypothetical protein n=1 Tax=Bartonella sp. CB178 TaxID=3112255 RepID=UPI00300DFB73